MQLPSIDFKDFFAAIYELQLKKSVLEFLFFKKIFFVSITFFASITFYASMSAYTEFLKFIRQYIMRKKNFNMAIAMALTYCTALFCSDSTVTVYYEKAKRNCQDIASIRIEMDRINNEILQLLAERTAYVQRAGDLKSLTSRIADDRQRVAEQAQKIADKSRELELPLEISLPSFQVIMETSIQYQQKYIDQLVSERNVSMDCASTYSSYTKGLFHYSANLSDDVYEVILELPCEYEQKIAKRIAKFPNEPVLSLNGIPAQIEEKHKVKDVLVVSCKMSALFAQCLDKKNVSLGMRSNNNAKWLLAGAPLQIVTFKSMAVADGHRYRQELTFACSKDQYERIEKTNYLGLNGSGFMVQKRFKTGEEYYFAVHAGQSTRDKTIFNPQSILSEQSCVLSFPVNKD